MEVHDIKIGDRVKTRKGGRYHKQEARARIMIVLNTGSEWRNYEAAICEYHDKKGRRTTGLFLIKNLVKVEEQ